MREDRQAVQTECLASVGWRSVAYGAADDRVTVIFQYGDKLISKDAEFVSAGAALTGPQCGSPKSIKKVPNTFRSYRMPSQTSFVSFSRRVHCAVAPASASRRGRSSASVAGVVI